MNKKNQSASIPEGVKQKDITGNRRKRRAMQRKADEYYALHCYEVYVLGGEEQFWVIAINTGHVKELILQCPEGILQEDINSIEAMNPEQMKLITIQANEDMELEETTLFDVFNSYLGSGGIICSTMWID